MRTINGNIALFISLTVVGCGGVDPGQPPSNSTETPRTGAPSTHLVDRMRALDHDLQPGAQGESVRTVYDYLSRYGYFPNDQLQKKYPAWRPIVADPPANPDVYDDHMATAVREYQTRSGMTPSGIVDGPTRNMMAMARCGVPDGIPPVDPSDKYNFLGYWYNAGFTWSSDNDGMPGIPYGVFYQLTQAALATWTGSSNLSFATSSSADVDINPGSTWGDGAIGETNYWTHNITINQDYPWSQHSEISGTYDLEHVLLHEIGHALGLSHSSNNLAVMLPTTPTGPSTETLGIDDKVAISQRYDGWTQAVGDTARDIAAGVSGYTWIITNTPHPQSPGNFTIKAWDGTSWLPDAANGGAVRIALDTYGYPWVVCADGSLFRRSNNAPGSGSWQWMPGSAQDIAVGGHSRAQEAVWIVSNTPQPGNPGNFVIKKWNATTQAWDPTSGAGVRVGSGDTGSPWVVAVDGSIWRICDAPTGQCNGISDVTRGYWQNVGGGRVTDVAVSPWYLGNGLDYAFATGVDFDGNGNASLYTWQQQPGVGGGDPVPEQKNEWIALTGRAKNISVGFEGKVWVATSPGYVYTSQK